MWDNLPTLCDYYPEYCEELEWTIYNAFRDYSGLEISYNEFVKELEKLTLKLGDKYVRTKK